MFCRRRLRSHVVCRADAATENVKTVPKASGKLTLESLASEVEQLRTTVLGLLTPEQTAKLEQMKTKQQERIERRKQRMRERKERMRERKESYMKKKEAEEKAKEKSKETPPAFLLPRH